LCLRDRSISAPGYLTHNTKITLTASHSDVVLDLIASEPPFSLDFYRQFARNGFEFPPGRASTARWTMSPSFYVRTVTDDTGEPVPSIVLAGIKRVIMNSVPELTAGKFQVAAFEMGTDLRAPQQGSIAVNFFHTFPTPGAVGDSAVGANPGQIRLLYGPSLNRDLDALESSLGCESPTVVSADHEIVHAMGFYHTDDTFHDFLSGPGCPGNGRPARVRYHAAVMYSRPRDNTDIDNDPTDFSLPLSVEHPTLPRIACPLEAIMGTARHR
jgi:hypothetical protein